MNNETNAAPRRSRISIGDAVVFAIVAVSLAVIAVTTSCAGSTVSCTASVTPTYAKVTAFSKCTSCHASTLSGAARQDAPIGIDYDTYGSAVANINAGLREIEEGRMPPGGGLTADEQTALETWASCGEPQ